MAAAKPVRLGRTVLEDAHRFARAKDGRDMDDRAAVETCIEATGDAALGNVADYINVWTRAIVAVQILAAIRVLFGEEVALREFGGRWWISTANETGSGTSAISSAAASAACQRALETAERLKRPSRDTSPTRTGHKAQVVPMR